MSASRTTSSTPADPKRRWGHEVTQPHTRLLKCALIPEVSRRYWAAITPGEPATNEDAFRGFWFGDRSEARVAVLMTNLRARYDAFPMALEALHAWPHMADATRRVICHVHLQLTDPTYRAFTSGFLPARFEKLEPAFPRAVAQRWVEAHTPSRFKPSTLTQLTGKLLSSAYQAGLLSSNTRGARPPVLPRVPDEALTYLLYLLRDVDFDGTVLRNPYLTSLGLTGGFLTQRLAGLPGVSVRRLGDTVELTWHHEHLLAWVRHHTAGAP